MNTLKKKIIFTIFIIIIIRIGNLIPVPYIEQKSLINVLNTKPWLKTFFNSETLILSVFSLGIIPSINASILMQLLTTALPFLENLQKEEGENGRKKIKGYTRQLTLFFAITESLSILYALKPILFNCTFFIGLQICLILTTGSMILLWLSDLISENGIGNGSTLMITLNTFSVLPNTIRSLSQSTRMEIIFIVVDFILTVMAIIILQAATQKIPLISAKQLVSQPNIKNVKISYIPLKLNQNGVMPIIFSSALLTFLTFIVTSILDLKTFFPNLNKVETVPIIYGIFNFSFIFFFSKLYSNLIINTKEIAKELNQRSITIFNVRPGKQTSIYLKKTLRELSTCGALFLASLVALPNLGNKSAFTVTSLIIVVGFTSEIARQVQAILIPQKN